MQVKYGPYTNKSSDRKPIQIPQQQQHSQLYNKIWHITHNLELPDVFLHYSQSHNIQLLLQMQLQKVMPSNFTCLYPLRVCYKIANLKHVLNLIKELSIHPGNFGKIKGLFSFMMWLLLLCFLHRNFYCRISKQFTNFNKLSCLSHLSHR